MSVFGDVLKEVVKRRGLTQRELAMKLGKTAGYISHLTTGRQKTVDLELSSQLANALDTGTTFWSDLFHDEETNRARSVDSYLSELDLRQTVDVPPGILVDFQIETMIQAARDSEFLSRSASPGEEHLWIDNFDAERLQASSYDLIIGGVWRDKSAMDRAKFLSERDLFTVRAHSYELAFTLETICMPAFMHARVSQSASFARSGLIVSHGPIVDPCFEGVLTVAVHNYGDEDISIPVGDPFLTLVFERLTAMPQKTRELRPDPSQNRPVDAEERRLSAENRLLREKLAAMEARIAAATRDQ